MASAELRRIQRRIRSVRSTMKITRAMELIATSRIARAQQRVAAAQPYTQKMNEVIRNVAAASGGITHPLLETRPVRTAGVLVVTSDREIAVFAERRGKTAIDSPAFADRLDRIAAGNLPAAPPEMETEDDDDRAGSAKKKGPSRRLSKQKRAALARLRKL